MIVTSGLKMFSVAGTVRYLHPILDSCVFYYFEAKIVYKGSSGSIAIGLCTDSLDLPENSYGSCAYHSDEGSLYINGRETPFGPPFTTGDIVGCGVDTAQKFCFYTKNGLLIGSRSRFNKLMLPLNRYEYPCVQMRKGDVVEINFGLGKFVCDLSTLRYNRLYTTYDQVH